MILTPTILFLIFLLHYIRKCEGKLNLTTLLLSIYLFSSVMYVVADSFDLLSIDLSYYRFSIAPVVVYCITLLSSIMILSSPELHVKQISPIRNISIVKFVAWVAAIYVFFFTLMSYSSIVRNLTSNMGELRNDMYLGIKEASWMARMPELARLPFALMNMILGCPWISQFFAFYCIAILQLPHKYFILFIIASLLGPVGSIVGLDRSGMVYWCLGFIGVFLYFKPWLSRQNYRMITKTAKVLVFLVFLYLGIMTISRFGDEDGGVIDSLVSYTGMSFGNFCYFYDNYTPPILTPQIVFPFSSNFVLNTAYGNSVELQKLLSELSQERLGVFYTYLGHIMTTGGKGLMFAYIAIYLLFGIWFINRINKKTAISLTESLIFVALNSVLLLGLFGHYYSSPEKTFSLFFFIMFSKILSKI